MLADNIVLSDNIDLGMINFRQNIRDEYFGGN